MSITPRTVASALGVAVIGLVVVYLATRPTATPPSPPVPAPESAETADAEVPRQPAPPTLPTGDVGTRVEIPVTGDESFLDSGLGLDLKASYLKRHTDRVYLHAVVLLRNDRRDEIYDLRLETILLDADGQEVKRKNSFLIIPTTPPMRPGDIAPLHVVTEAPLETAGAKLHLFNLEARQVESYPPSTPLPIQWLASPVTGVELRATLRSGSADTNGRGGYWHKVVIELTNLGDVPLQQLTLNVGRKGADGEYLRVEPIEISRPDGVPFYGGDRRVFSSLESVDAEVRGLTLQVMSAIAVGPSVP